MSDWPLPDWSGSTNNQNLPYISVSQEDVLDDPDSSGQGSSCRGSKLLLSVGAGKEEDLEICSISPLLESGVNTPTTELDHGLLGLSDAHFKARSISECGTENLVDSEPVDIQQLAQIEIEVLSPTNKEPDYSFVSWNWPIIRNIVTYASIGTVFSVVIASIALIANLSPDCHNLKNWWQGSVFMDSRQDMQQADFLKVADLGVTGFILRDLFELNEDGLVERLDESEIHDLIVLGRAKNVSFIGEAYILNYNHTNIVQLFNRVDRLQLQGLLLRGMNVSAADINEMKIEWNKIAYKQFMHQKILVVTSDFARLWGSEILEKFDLVYTQLNTENLDETLNMQVNEEHKSDGERYPWTQWAYTDEHEYPAFTKALQYMQLILPGTPLVAYDSKMVNDCTEVGYYTNLKRMISLRHNSMAVSSNRALIHGDFGTLLEQNTNILVINSTLVVIERSYPRAKRFILVANFGNESIRTESLYKHYFGGPIAASTIGRQGSVDFKDFEIQVGEAVVVEMSI